MLLSIYSRKTLFLAFLLFMFLLQAFLVVFQRREVYFSGEVFSLKSSPQNKTTGGGIFNFLNNIIIDKDQSLNNEQNVDPSKSHNPRVKVRSYREIEESNLNIFFIESRCGTIKSSRTFGLDFSFNLRPRQCCSVESAATMNPTRNVYILHTCPLGKDFELHLPKYSRNMLGLSNVYVVPMSMGEALEGTPVTSLYRSGKLENSNYAVVHASDILRLAVLWRFGGTYCDMDILFIRSLSGLQSNFCGLESNKSIGNSILNFEPTGHGHEILTKILVRVNTHFNGQLWAVNGPQLITNTLLRECGATIVTVTQCTAFTVYNQTVFYPLLWKNHEDLFNASAGADIVKSLKDTGFTVHLWNSFTIEYSVQVGSSQAYGLLADEFCPAVYRNCGVKF